MQPSWVSAVEQALKRAAPALEKWTEVESILSDHKKCYKQVLRPTQMLVHPRNRAGLGLNGSQVHKTGAQVQSVGFSSMELRRSVCMEISTDPTVSQEAFAFNQRQVDLNGGLLAEVRGDERFMSLACSHFTAFCRACLAQCPCSDHDNVSDSGKLSLHCLSPDFRAAVENGWEWLVLSAEVDARVPALASFIQEVMNAAQGVARTAGELELAMAMVTRAVNLEAREGSADWTRVQQDVAACVPDAAPQTLAACSLISRFYAGGSSAPLLVFLHDFSLKYGASKRLGEEYMSTVATLKFSGQERSHAMARAALIATNLTATRVVDGIARLLTKGDISKLAGKSMEESVKQWEDLLGRAWSRTSQVADGPGRAKALECFGRLMVRTTLFMCKKETAGQEGLEHGSLGAILSLYEAEMGMPSSGTRTASEQPSAAEPAGLATLEEMQDPVYLMKLQGYHLGKLYKGKQSYAEMWPWRLQSVDQSHAHLSPCGVCQEGRAGRALGHEEVLRGLYWRAASVAPGAGGSQEASARLRRHVGRASSRGVLCLVLRSFCAEVRAGRGRRALLSESHVHYSGREGQGQQVDVLSLHRLDLQDWVQAGSGQCGGVARGHGHQLVRVRACRKFCSACGVLEHRYEC